MKPEARMKKTSRSHLPASRSLHLRIFASFIALALIAWTLCALVTCLGAH